ncbi:MAG TPA: peptidoglycan-binding domain-containing protein [Acidobacteriaceae bacterium]|jgi:peptidoglycan hydrolase-like protein with peptidoglycan-binding domain
MRFHQLTLWSALALTLTIPSLASARTRRGPGAPKPSAKRSTKTKTVGQRAIDDERATQIQEALIKAGYLTGTPSGHWDTTTEAAMTKVQADNGWQTKLVPDSRALIKLGLGPINTAAIPNPEPETIAEVH